MDLMDYRRKIIANSPHLSSASGAVASFSDGADLPLKSLVVDIEPVQSGSGDPSSTNIRPISGWKAVNIYDDPIYGNTIDWNQKISNHVAIDLGKTVYGGTLNPLTGELVVDKAMMDLGILAWAYRSATGLFYSNSFPSCKNNTTKLIFSNREWTPKSSQSEVRATDKTICKNSNGSFYVHDSSYNTPADFQSAMRGSMMCFELATPLTYHLDPQTVRSLYGQNNIWADTGNTSLEYWAHP